MTFVENKKARMRFSVMETFEAGIELIGAEVKSLRAKQGSLDGARVLVRGGEAFLAGMTIPPYQSSNTAVSYEPERNRKLLLKKSEIVELSDAEAKKGLTVVPLSVYNKGRYVKVQVAIVKGKNKADKREDMKRDEAKMEADRAMKIRKLA